MLDAGFNESIKSKIRRALKETLMNKRALKQSKIQRRVSLRRASVATTNNAGDGIKLVVVDG